MPQGDNGAPARVREMDVGKKDGSACFLSRMIFSVAQGHPSKIFHYFDNLGTGTNGCAISEVLRRFFKSDRTPSYPPADRAVSK